jgi:hypothetical protein
MFSVGLSFAMQDFSPRVDLPADNPLRWDRDSHDGGPRQRQLQCGIAHRGLL